MNSPSAPSSAANEKLFWTLISLRVSILLLISSFSLVLASFILFLVPALSFSSKPAALPEITLCFYLLAGVDFFFFSSKLMRNCADGEGD